MKPESVERTDEVEKVDSLSISELLASGKRDFLVGDLPNALKSLQRAVALSSAKYGEFAIECGEAYYLFGCALLDRARSENEVLGEAVKGVPLGEKSNDAEAEDGDEKGSGVVSDSEGEGAESAEKADREQLADMIIDALCASSKAENTADAEKDATAAQSDATATEQKAETEGEVKTSEAVESKASESTEAKASETSEVKTSETTEPKASEASEPKASEASEPKASEVTEPKASEVNEPKASEVTESKASEVTESEASEVTESKASEVTEPKASEVNEPKASEVTEPKVSETSEPKASETSEPKAAEATPTQATEAMDTEATEAKAGEADVPADSTTKPKGEDAEDEENGDDDEESVDSTASSDADGEAEGDAEGDAEERTTLGVAWEWLDLARIVFDKQSRAFSGAEPSSSGTAAAEQPAASASSEQPEQASASTSEGELQCVAKQDARRCAARLADCHVRLGEVLMERAEFESAIGEYEAALRIRESQRDAAVASTGDNKDDERLDGEMRALAETYYQLALANQNAERYDDAVRSFERAVETLTARRTQLSARLERSEKDSDAAEKFTADIEDLDGCVTDLRQRIADAVDEKRFKALAQQESAATTVAPFGTASDTGSAAVTANDATHLVKRKRKADGVDNDIEGEEKENGKAVATTGLKDAAEVQADGDAQVDTDGVPAKTRKVEVEQEGATNA